jgi:hypothetical protein
MQILSLFKQLSSNNLTQNENNFIPGAEKLSPGLKDFVNAVNKERGAELYNNTMELIAQVQAKYHDLNRPVHWMISSEKRHQAFQGVNESNIIHPNWNSYFNFYSNESNITIITPDTNINPTSFGNTGILDVLTTLQANKETVLQNTPQIAEIIKGGEVLGSYGNKSLNDVITQVLGEFGTKTLNDIVEQGIDNFTPVIEFLQNNSDIISIGGSVLTPLLIYKGITHMYSKTESTDLERIKIFSKEIYTKELKLFYQRKFFFYSFVAPVMTSLFYQMYQINSKPLINIEIELPSTSQSSSFFLLLINKFKKWPILTILAIVFILKFLGLNVEKWFSYLNNPVFLKWTMLICIVISFLLVLDGILSIILFILFTKGKIKVPNLLPSYFYDRLKLLESLSQSPEEAWRFTLDFELKNLLMYVVLLSVCVIMYIIYY